jgi:hypothetical protein
MGCYGTEWVKMGSASIEKAERNERLANPHLDLWSLALVSLENEKTTWKGYFNTCKQTLK